MVRVTLERDYGKRIRMLCGYEIVVPMQFGAADPAVMVDFRNKSAAMPARPNEYFLDFADEDHRSTLMPDEFAVLYFGNPNTGIEALVQQAQAPPLHIERERVANVWGGYLYSDRHGPYTTIAIDVPRVPHVVITPVDHNGMTRAAGKVYRPWEMFKFEELLAPNAAAEMREYHKRRAMDTGDEAVPQLDISKLTPAQLKQIAALMKASA